MNKTTAQTFRLLCLIKKCRDKGKIELALKLIDKYGKDIFMKKVNALQYWKNKNITYDIFKEDNQIKIYNILYNRRRL